MSEVQIGTADPDYEIYRTEVSHRPNTKVGELSVVTSSQTEIEMEMKETACGVVIPEMTVIPDTGVTMVVSDVNIWDDFGNSGIGKSYELTDANNDRLVIQIYEAVQVSPGVQGQVENSNAADFFHD